MTKSFFSFLCLYIFFIIAFGLGFYVSLNTYVITEETQNSNGNSDVKGTNDNPSETKTKNTIQGEDFKFFNTSWKALVKASTMFSGELVRNCHTHLKYLDILLK